MVLNFGIGPAVANNPEIIRHRSAVGDIARLSGGMSDAQCDTIRLTHYGADEMASMGIAIYSIWGNKTHSFAKLGHTMQLSQ